MLKNIVYTGCNRCVNIIRTGVKTDNANTSGLNYWLEIVSELNISKIYNVQLGYFRGAGVKIIKQ